MSGNFINDVETMRTLVWMLVQLRGGEVVITREQVKSMVLEGTLEVKDTKERIVIKTIPKAGG